MLGLKASRRCSSALVLLGMILATPGLAAPAETSQDIRQRVDAEFHNRNFEVLENRARSYRQSSERTVAGEWKLAAFYQQLAVNTGPSWINGSLKSPAWSTIDAWQTRFPDSVAAVFARIMALCTFANVTAWSANTGKMPTDTWNVDTVALDEAKRLLEEVRPRAKDDPHWHALRLRIMRLDHATPDDLIIAHEEALAEWPGYFETNNALFDHLQEAWIGRPELIEAYANTVYSRTKQAEGEQVYARLFQYALETSPGLALFKRLNVDWSRLRAGYRQIIERFPTAKNAQQLALLSCLKGDWQSAAEVFRARDEPPSREVWQQPLAYKSCKATALK